MSANTAGLALASCTAIGSALCEFGRKRLTSEGLDSASIISLVCLIQGVFGFTGLFMSGLFVLPGSEFWAPALASAACSAFTATLLTKAYATGDISLCAPFNAALPVFQFLTTSFIIRDEEQLAPHKVGGVVIVVVSSFALARAGRPPASSSSSSSRSLLPKGASFVLLCCAIWSFVTKFDQLATKAAGSPIVYVCYAKTLTGLWAAFGATLFSSSSASSAAKGKKGGGAAPGAFVRSVRLLSARPMLALLIIGVAAIEGSYMGCYFAALTRISKTVVVAVKKGGNLLVSSVGGWVIFGEKADAGRVLPVIAVVSGVVVMSF